MNVSNKKKSAILAYCIENGTFIIFHQSNSLEAYT